MNNNCNTSITEEDNVNLKQDFSEFLDILQERIKDVTFDKNYLSLLEQLSDLEHRTYLSGISSVRPDNAFVGQIFFDLDLNKPLFFNGSTWVDANGNIV